MTSSEFFFALREWIGTEVMPDTDLLEDLELDSIAILELILWIEDRAAVTNEPKRQPSLRTASDCCLYYESLTGYNES